jgi:hypothetical protein
MLIGDGRTPPPNEKAELDRRRPRLLSRLVLLYCACTVLYCTALGEATVGTPASSGTGQSAMEVGIGPLPQRSPQYPILWQESWFTFTVTAIFTHVLYSYCVVGSRRIEPHNRLFPHNPQPMGSNRTPSAAVWQESRSLQTQER